MNERDGLWAVFHLEENRYCLPGEALESIAIPQGLSAAPGLPQFCTGLLEYRMQLVPVVDLRVLLGLPSLDQRVEQFARMKQMHIDWVESLRESVATGAEFTKPVDPHLCKFGIWYDHFETDDTMLNHILDRISEPHAQIHFCGAQSKRLLAEGKSAAGPLAEAEAICRDEIVPLLDRLIDAYREANRGVIFILNVKDRRTGLLVDKAAGLLPKERTVSKELPCPSTYFHSVVLNGNAAMLCLEPARLPFLFSEG